MLKELKSRYGSLTVIDIKDFIVSDGSDYENDKVYKWIILEKEYFGTIKDFVESFGIRGKKYTMTCPRCHKVFTKSGDAVMRTGFYCHYCAVKKTNGEKRNSKKIVNIVSYDNRIKDYWDYSKNDRDIESVSIGEHQEFWFKCSKGHSYKKNPRKMIISLETKTKGCPYCAGQKFSSDNSIAEKYPYILDIWDYDKNSKKPDEVVKGTSESFWFKCPNGHSYLAKPYKVASAVRSGSRSKGCPYCSSKRISFEMSFGGKYPDKLKYWDYDKNTVSPYDVFCYSERLYWFKCPKGHSFQIIPHSVITSKGSGCRICSGVEVLEGYNDIYTTDEELVRDYWDFDCNILSPFEVSRQSTKEVWWYCSNCGEAYYQRIDSRVNSKGLCPTCAESYNRSSNEVDLYNFILKLFPDAVYDYYIDGRSYDIFIPSKGFIIEYNGIYFHSEAIHPEKNYQYEKYRIVKEAGYSFYAIWEDDWVFNNEICKKGLMSKLGVLRTKSLNARDCIVSDEYSEELLKRNHIQGTVKGCKYLSLKDKNNNIVSEIAYKVRNDSIEIVRFVSNGNVRGAFSKLLNHLEKLEVSCTNIYTFSDNSVSDGKLYENNGFEIEKYIEPDYAYVYKGRRVHKFNFRIERFREDENLLFEEGLTEHELALKNKIYRVYDYGKKKWVKNIIRNL